MFHPLSTTAHIQRLPMIDSKPLKLYMVPDAKPVAVYTAATVPLHWREEVKAKLIPLVFRNKF